MKKTSYAAVLSLILLLGDSYLSNSIANQNIPINKPLQFNPPNNGAPKGSRSSKNSGSRDDCPALEKTITALIPKTNWANTLAERPKFWFHIPHKQGRLTLILRNKTKSIQVNYQVRNGGGIMGFPVPETLPALEINESYFYKVYFTCNPKNQPSKTGIQGIVKRVAMNEVLQTKLTSATSIKEKIHLYANEGLWYEAITALIESRRSQPIDKELEKYWSYLLSDSDVELQDLISEPLIDCCSYISK
ncbi:MAG: DUF928 domain-containing protein [Richelia sp. RM2_1_2]|nr:DUF928 domain-containing protein [Richelia sp. RM2_1_2]